MRGYAKDYGREIRPNANTLEDSLDQYDSMVKAKIMADSHPNDPRWLQIQSSSELVPWKLFWPVVPTYWQGGLKYGDIQPGLR